MGMLLLLLLELERDVLIIIEVILELLLLLLVPSAVSRVSTMLLLLLGPYSGWRVTLGLPLHKLLLFLGFLVVFQINILMVHHLINVLVMLIILVVELVGIYHELPLLVGGRVAVAGRTSVMARGAAAATFELRVVAQATGIGAAFVDHLGNLLDELEEVDAMLGVAIDYLLSADVRQIILQDLLAEQIDQRLNVLCHLGLVLASRQLREVYLGESRLEELDVELITEKDRHIVDGLCHPQVPQDVISELNYDLHN